MWDGIGAAHHSSHARPPVTEFVRAFPHIVARCIDGEAVRLPVVSSSGRVVIVGGRAGPLAERLSARGYECQTVARVTALQKVSSADVVILSTTGRSAKAAVGAVRRSPGLRRSPLLLDAARVPPEVARGLDVDGRFDSFEGLERLLEASLKARRALQRDDLVRARLELLLELSRERQTTPMEALVARVAGRLREALGCEQVQALLLEGEAPSRAFLLDSGARLPVDLAVAPSLRRALELREPVASEAGQVVPLDVEGPGVVALVLKRRAPLEREERDFVEALGGALRDAAERSRAHQAEATTHASLEAAYVDRFRELTRANERLKALDRKKNELMAVLTHDLRAPLNVLIGHAHLLLTDADLTPTQRVSVEVIQRTSRKVLELAETLLEKSRGGEQLVLFTRTMDVAETCQQSVRDLQILAREQGVQLRAEAPLSLPVLGDEQKIRQVLQNLITNALTHAKGLRDLVVRARLKTRPDGDVALVEVCDDGQVGDANELLLAFERSRGLGLAIARDYVERHGGEIWAEAPAGGGAVFAFTLPIEAGVPRRAPEVRGDLPLVLLAEEDPVLQRMAAMALSGHYRVETARGGDEVLRRVRALRPDVVVMSAFMPGKDGLEVLRELDADPATRDVPSVLVAGSPEMAARLEGVGLGPVDVLTRPFALSTLLTRVGVAVQRSRARPGLTPLGVDAETGLFDHLGIVNRLQQEMSRSVRYERPLTLAVLRPSAPPGAGTQACVNLVRGELRAPDVVGHLGGGVLALVLPETSPEAARPTLERLCARLGTLGVSYRPRLADVQRTAADDEAEAALERLLS